MEATEQNPRPIRAYHLYKKSIEAIGEDVKNSNFTSFREYMKLSRERRDWEHRVYLLEKIARDASLDAIDAACAAEPEAVELHILRAAHYMCMVKVMRGSGTVDKVSGERFHNAAEYVKAAMDELPQCTELDNEDPTAYALVLPCLTVFGQLRDRQLALFARAAELAPDFENIHLTMVRSSSERWYGSHLASLEVARAGMKHAAIGGDMAGVLFAAHNLVRTHFSGFDKNRAAAESYLRLPEVTRELNAAFDAWMAPPYQSRRASSPYMQEAANWYKASGDKVRLAHLVEVTGGNKAQPQTPQAPTPQAPPPPAARGGWLGRMFGGRA